ncbi:ribosome maturation factor RimP, partial [Burkholderia pseudomallei]
MKKSTEAMIEELVLPITNENNIEIVDVEYVKEAGEYYLRIFIDKDGGVSLNDCEVVTRAINPI